MYNRNIYEFLYEMPINFRVLQKVGFCIINNQYNCAFKRCFVNYFTLENLAANKKITV